MNRKTIIWVTGVVIFLVALIFFTRDRSPFGKRNTSFSADPVKEITRIELSSGRDELVLEKKGDKWLLNDKLETRKSSISFITGILREIRIKSPVSPELFDTVAGNKGIQPVRVKAFEGNRRLSDFLVFRTSSNIYGNIMKKNRRAKPFIVHVPGFDGDIGSVFNMHELYWQPYTIFNLLPSEIASVHFENLKDGQDSFLILRKNNFYSLSDGSDELTGWDSSLVSRYISYFTFIPFESWALDINESERSKIVSSPPAFRITVKTTDGKEVRLTLWERKTEDGSIDSDRLFGKTETSEEIFIVRYFDIDPLLKQRGYFFKTD